MRTREFTWCINYESDEMDIVNETYPNENVSSTIDPELIRKEQERIDFYNTYDVMTGVRIAYTLGGFFGLMVILVLYKSKSKTEKALEDPHLAAAAVAEVEEEERQIAAALEEAAYEQLNPRRSRRSIDTSSVSPRWIRNSKRFSSIAGYSTLMDPPQRLSKLPSSIDEDSPEDARVLYDEIYPCYESHLDIPNRRPSNVTCSSSGSSYLERRGSSVMLGLPTMPPHKLQGHQGHQMRRRQSSPLPEQYDFYYPIDIRVIQPTPGGSPCGSERALYDVLSKRQRLTPRLAPLASISSCNSSSMANDYPDLDMNSHASYVSDSVFHEMDYYEDTDDEVDPFSTDSDEEEDHVQERERSTRLDEIYEDEDEDAKDRPCCSQDCHRRVSAVGKPMSPLSTISDESTSTLIGAGEGVKPAEEDTEVAGAAGRTESRMSKTSASSLKGIYNSESLGALGATLESLERKRGSCCSADGSSISSPHSPNSRVNLIGDDNSASSIAIIGESRDLVHGIDSDDIEMIDVDVGEENAWSKETLF